MDMWHALTRRAADTGGGRTARFFKILVRISVLARTAALAAIALGFAASVSLAAVSPSEKRVALVIGNGAYRNAVHLDNAAFDARAVADAFRKLGFQVVDGYDLDIDQMRSKVSEFSAALSDSKSAVIYYAGHGISVDEENYLVPTDIVLKSPTDLDLNAISVSLLLKQMKRDDRVNIIILDACRDNPFAAALAKQKTRALVAERGLTRIDGDLARGTLIAFASDPKSTALDGPAGQHSPFTQAFLAHLFDSGVTIDTVMSRVRNEVWEKTQHNQLPWVNTSLIGEYELNPQPLPELDSGKSAPAPTETSMDARQAQENLMWESAQHSNLGADYQAYLSAFPGGVFAQMAKNRIASLESARASAPAAPTLAMTEPVGLPETELKDNVGTVETERALNLSPASAKEVQQRLTALDLYKGPVTGTLDQATRAALAEWQKRRGFAPTSFLDSAEVAALKADSETEYQKLLAAEPATQPTVQEAPRRVLSRPAPKAAVVRAAKPATPAAPTRRVVKRTTPNRYETADQAASPPPFVDPGGSPAWRHRAGLPELPTDPGMGGRPPGFWTGSSGGLLLGGFRH
jgi:peptidoglycan hydrolase-like protein with peptidoglycan-binding domain